MACVRSGSESELGAGSLRDGDSVGRTDGPAGGLWRCWGAGPACAGAGRWYPGVNLQGAAGAWGLGLPLDMWAWGRMVPRRRSGWALVPSIGVAVRVRVRQGRRTVCGPGSLSVGLASSGAGGAQGWPVSRLLAGGRVWTRRVVFGVVDPGHRQNPGLGSFVGAWCRGVARAGRLRLPYSCGLAFFSSRQVMPGASGSLWLRGAAAGVVVLPVWIHFLVGGFVACRPSMVPDRL